jgi:hypothetical protein
MLPALTVFQVATPLIVLLGTQNSGYSNSSGCSKTKIGLLWSKTAENRVLRGQGLGW